MEEESNDRTLPVETPCVNTANESQLIQQIAPTSSPTTETSKTALSNRDQTTVNAPPPVVNETKIELTNGTQSSTKQPEAENPVIRMDKNQYDKPNGNKESKAKTSTPETEEMDTDKTGQDQIKKLGKSEVIPENIEQPNLIQNTTNKESVIQDQEKPEPQDKPVTNDTTNIRMCTVRLEILTEADILKHVHVHKEIKSKMNPPAKLSELVGTVETVETTYFTRSCTKTKLPRTNRLPRTVSGNITYLHQDEQSDSGNSPSAKRKRNSRPRMEPSSSRIKADSFSTKSPSVRPLLRSTRSANSQSPPTNQVPTTSGISNMTSPPVSTAASSNAGKISKGTFTTQSFHLKKSKKTHKIGCRLCDTVYNSNKELTQHHQLKHNILYCDECSKAFNNPSSLAKHQYSHRELRFKCTDCDEEFAF